MTVSGIFILTALVASSLLSLSTAENLTCSVCPEAHFCTVNGKNPCPGDMTSGPGSSNVSDCSCPVGTMQQGDSACIRCPEFSSEVYTDGVLECFCAAGFTLSDAQCVSCLNASVYCANNSAHAFPVELEKTLACDKGYTPSQEVRELVATPVLQLGEWSHFSVEGDAFLANAFVLEVYPGLYTEEYVEVCTVEGCENVYYCKGTCPPALKGAEKLYAFEDRLVTQVSLFIGALSPPELSMKTTLVSTALQRYNASCVCNNGGITCPAQCDAEKGETRDSFISCKCGDGYFQSSEHVELHCLHCPLSSYCSGGLQMQCPNNQETYGYGSVSVEDCQCSPGYKEDEGGVCVLCEKNVYCSQGVAQACPTDYWTVSTGSSLYADCIAVILRVSVLSVLPNSSLEVVWITGQNQTRVIASVFANSTALGPLVLEGAVSLNDARLQLLVIGEVTVDGIELLNYGNVPDEGRDCPVGFFCAGNMSIEACPLNSNTEGTGSSDASQCLCNAGYFLNDANGTCEECPLGSYKEAFLSNALCNACGDDQTTLQTGSVDKTQCVCVSGFEENGYGCVECRNGTFKEEDGSMACSVCPDFTSTTQVGAASATECLCSPGFELVGGVCAPCPPGSYKEDYANANCTPCPVNTYNSGVGAANRLLCFTCPVGTIGEVESMTSVEQCEECPSGSYYADPQVCVVCPDFTTSSGGAIGIHSCKCVAGFSRNGSGACVPCFPGSFKNVTGDGACSLCPPGTYEPRYGAVDSPCVSCPTGTYQPNLGGKEAVECIMCPVGKFSPHPEAYNESSCETCPVLTSTTGQGAYSMNQCVCVSGYTAVNGTCTACSTGQYKYFVGNGACVHCDPRTTTVPGIVASSAAACVCDAGFYRKDTVTCVSCPLGTYKEEAEDTAQCVQCPLLQTTTAQGSKTKSSCVCDAGSYLQQFNETSQEAVCVLCNESSFSVDVGADSCHECPKYALTLQGATSSADCVCIESFIQNVSGACVCPLGMYVDETSSSCTPCPWGTYMDEANIATSCIQCEGERGTIAIGAHSSDMCVCVGGFVEDVSGDCLCSPGKYFEAGECLECDALSYKGDVGNGQCSPCPQYSTTLVTGAILETDCLCREGLQKVGGECLCNLGHYYEESMCKPCALGSYKDTHSLDACTPCGPNRVTLSGGSDSSDKCVCGTGFEELAGNSECAPCNTSMYKATAGGHLCTQCPLHSFALESGAVSAEQCLCKPGMYRESNGECAPCLAGTYKQTYEGGCKTCPNNHSSFEGASSQTQCLCDKGMGFVQNESSCRPCENGYVKYDISNTPCSACLPDIPCLTCEDPNTAEDTRFLRRQCLPVAGFFFDETGKAVECANGTYKEEIGTGPCVPCQHMQTSLRGSVSLDNCTCMQGYYLNASSVCVACEEGYECPGGGYQLSTSGNKKCTMGTCVCVDGYHYNMSGSCVECDSVGGCEADDCNGTHNRARLPDTHECVCIEGYFLFTTGHDTSIYNTSRYENAVGNGDGNVSLVGRCAPCPGDTFKEDKGNNVCTPCSNNTSTCGAVGAPDISRCKVGAQCGSLNVGGGNKGSNTVDGEGSGAVVVRRGSFAVLFCTFVVSYIFTISY